LKHFQVQKQQIWKPTSAAQNICKHDFCVQYDHNIIIFFSPQTTIRPKIYFVWRAEG